MGACKIVSNFLYRESDHTYWLDGRRLYGVTEVLKAAGLLPPFGDEWAAERGSAVHLACKYLARGELDWDSVDQRIEPYVRAYERFLKDTRFEAWKVEEALYHADDADQLPWYAGTFDAYGNWPDVGVSVIDLKTGGKAKYHAPQLSAYRQLILEAGWKPPEHRVVLHLSADGNYTMAFQRDEWPVFETALRLVAKEEQEIAPLRESLRRWLSQP